MRTHDLSCAQRSSCHAAPHAPPVARAPLRPTLRQPSSRCTDLARQLFPPVGEDFTVHYVGPHNQMREAKKMQIRIREDRSAYLQVCVPHAACSTSAPACASRLSIPSLHACCPCTALAAPAGSSLPLVPAVQASSLRECALAADAEPGDSLIIERVAPRVFSISVRKGLVDSEEEEEEEEASGEEEVGVDEEEEASGEELASGEEEDAVSEEEDWALESDLEDGGASEGDGKQRRRQRQRHELKEWTYLVTKSVQKKGQVTLKGEVATRALAGSLCALAGAVRYHARCSLPTSAPPPAAVLCSCCTRHVPAPGAPNDPALR